ncbi:helix-hairpin-helix domain-containing protein [Selenomonas sp.]|uniref:helix-hairpin-helix domain-containing protein n=1 Tax=Selenomonas sp. TaxID=2053611 RepID=UPI003FA2593C
MPMFKKSMLVLLAVVALAAGGAFYAGARGQDDAVELDAGAAPVREMSVKESEIVVYVAGAVNHPGVVRLAEGARAKDAVDACGGFLPTADTNGVNLAQKLKDGVQVTVPEKAPVAAEGRAAQGAPTASGAARSLPDGMVNINTADEKELDKLPGIGPAMAKRIIEYRTENGAFQSPEEIKRVKGIGDAKYEKMKDKIVL